MDSNLIVATILFVVAFFLGIGKLAPAAKGKRPGRPDKPAEPDKPDVAPLAEKAARMDERGEVMSDEVREALDGAGEPDNPHGLADAANKRRR